MGRLLGALVVLFVSSALFSLLAACSGKDSPVNGDSSDSGSADADTDTDADTDADSDADCVGKGFSSSLTEWALPSGYTDGTFDSLYDADTTDGVTWALFDVGAGGADLVIAQTASDADVGSTKWLLHSNTGSRFRDGPLEWALPEVFEPGTFTTFSDQSTTDKVAWGLLDLNGDAKLDIVVTDTDAGTGGIGSSRWLLYANTGDGFSAASANWALPGGFVDGALTSLSDTIATDGVNWSLLDLNGDGALDIVVSDTEADDGVIGTTKWVYYHNNGAGFDGGIDWTLPEGFEPGTFVSLYDTSATDKVVWGLLDLSGDSKPDLVVTDTDSGGGGLGTTRWLMYKNTGSGFSGNSNWTLPGGFQDGALDTLGDGGTDDGIQWSLTDVTGDAVPDVVVTGVDADTTTGDTEWLVNAGGSNAFSSVTTHWPMPSGLGSNLFGNIYDASPTDALSWGLYNLGQDNVADLLVVKNSADAGVGKTYWQVAKVTCE